MLHHASRLVNTAPVVLATDFINSSLTEILQTAAGRAWVRRVNTNSISGKNGALHAKRDFYQPSRVMPAHAKRATHDDPQESPTSSTPQLSFNAHMSDKLAKIDKERSRLIAWKCGHLYLHKSFKPKLGKRKDVGVVPIPSKCLSEDDTCFVDPRRETATESGIDWPSNVLTRVNPNPIETIVSSPLRLPTSLRKTPTESGIDRPSNVLTGVNPNPIETIVSSPLRLPTSGNSLYQNLLALMSLPNGPVHLQALVSYHSRPHSHAFHSTRSFNLLISLAIRHASFGTAELLLSQMRAQGVKSNLETWKLRVRLMVRREEWDHAWEFVMSILRTQGWKERVGIPSEHGDRMPLAIWTEFMSTAKRGPFRRSIASEQGGRYEGEEEVLTAEPSEDQKEQASRALTSRRLNILMKYTPSLTPTECMRMPARTVSFIVWMMLVARHFGDARDMTRSYIAGLPPRLSTTTIRASLDIIHLHITGPTNRSPLHEHYNNRRTVEMFFAMHQDIKPDARTLFLLLRSLRRTTYSGILSRQIAKAFCRKWGYRAESRRVRDRITTFAVKEGNGEVVDIEWRKEMQSRLQERTYAVQTEVLGRTGRPPYYRLLRQPTRKIYKKRGVNIWRWRHLAQKIRQMAKTEKLRADT